VNWLEEDFEEAEKAEKMLIICELEEALLEAEEAEKKLNLSLQLTTIKTKTWLEDKKA